MRKDRNLERANKKSEELHIYIISHYGLASHTTHIVCINCIGKWRDLQFNIDSERQIFNKLFHGSFIYSQSFCQKSAERKSSKIYIFFIFRFDRRNFTGQ